MWIPELKNKGPKATWAQVLKVMGDFEFYRWQEKELKQLFQNADDGSIEQSSFSIIG